MEIKYIALVLSAFIIIVSLLYLYEATRTYPVIMDTEPPTSYILNQNTLNVVFPEQNLIINASDNSGLSKICYAIYDDAWLPDKSGKLYNGTCYDFEENNVGECDTESDIKIINNYLIPVNNTRIFPAPTIQFESNIPCSSNTKDHFGEDYKKELCHGIYNMALCMNSITQKGNYNFKHVVLFEGNTSRMCIKTSAGNFFRCMLKDYDFVQKQERIPRDLVCRSVNGSSGSVMVDISSIEDGIHYIAYTTEDSFGNVEETKTYTFTKTDKPYSAVSNPNTFYLLYPENELSWSGSYHFNSFLINAEYNKNLKGVWYGCDDKGWIFSQANEKLAYVNINKSVCKTAGLHTISYFAESSGLNGTVNEYMFFQSTERPRVENVSIGLELINNTYRLTALGNIISASNMPAFPIIDWYEDGGLKSVGEETLETPGGSNITVEYIPMDRVTLSGIPVNASIKTPNLPPIARDINITADSGCPPNLHATGDYHDPDGNKEGPSVYNWYDGNMPVSTGRTLPLRLGFLGNTTAEYIPVCSKGLVGIAINKTVFALEYLADPCLLFYAISLSDMSYCEEIGNETLRKGCEGMVNLSVCINDSKSRPEYCEYIRMDEYRNSCHDILLKEIVTCYDVSRDTLSLNECILGSAEGLNKTLCNTLVQTALDDYHLAQATKSRDTSWCYRINDTEKLSICTDSVNSLLFDYYFTLAVEAYNISLCHEIPDPEVSGKCTQALKPIVYDHYFTLAVEAYNISLCENIQDHDEYARCREAVEFGSQECTDRPTREKFFCIAFLKNDAYYCNYIDLDWYKFNCLALVSGSPEECMGLAEDERGLCITEFASSADDPSLCTAITDPDMRILCNALANRDPSACSSITDSSLRESCSLQASYQ